MRAFSAVALLLRRLRTDAGVVVLLFGVIAISSFVFAAAPRVFNRVTDDAVRYAVTTAPAVDRDLWLTANGIISPGTGGGVSAVEAYGQTHEADIPSSIARLISARYVGITSLRMKVQHSLNVLQLRYQDGVPDNSTLVAGRWPVDLGMQVKQFRLGQDVDPATPPVVVEAALSTAEADATGIHVGDQLPMTLDLSSTLVPPTVAGITPTNISIVGLYEPTDPTAAIWADTGMVQPTIKSGPQGIEAIYAAAYIPAEAYTNISTALFPFQYAWHFQIDPTLFDADQVQGLEQDLQRLNLIGSTKDTTYMTDLSASVGLTDITVQSRLGGIFDDFASQQARSESVLSIGFLGPLALAGATIAMLAVLLARRRRSNLLLARGRGASGSVVLGAQFLEAVLVAGGAALGGLVLAVAAVPSRDTPLSTYLAIAVAAFSVVLLMLATWPAARQPLTQNEDHDPGVAHVSRRRLVLEATIVGGALVAIVLLEERGLTLGTVGQTVRFDPLLAAVPLLCGVAAGIVAMRIYPFLAGALSRVAARRSDLVPVLSLRTMARRPTSANLLLVVLLLVAAFGAFASVVEATIDQGQIAASYREVGADYRLEAKGIDSLPATLDPSTIRGVDAVASGFVDASAPFVGKPNQRASIQLYAMDTVGYEKVTAGTAADPAWPAGFESLPPVNGVGTDANPIPAIVSTQLPAGTPNLGVGDRFTVSIDQQPVTFAVAQRRDTFPGLSSAAIFVIAPLDWVKASTPGALEPTVLWLRASADVTAPLMTMISNTSADVQIVSRTDAYGAVHDAPLGSAVGDGFGIALGVAVVYLSITLVCLVVISATGQMRDLAYMRTLGVSPRQSLGLTTMEHVPPALFGLVAGVVLGVIVAFLVEPGLGLADFVGAGASSAPAFVDWRRLALVIALLSVVVAAAIALGTWLARRGRLVSALRIDES